MSDLAGEFEKACAQALTEAMRDTLVEAGRLSSGPYSLEDLARMDHPYAVRHGSPLLPPEIINRQSGEFASEWKRTPILGSPEEPRMQVRNDSRVADFLKYGTRRMFARPIEGELEVYAEEQIARRLAMRLTAWAKASY